MTIQSVTRFIALSFLLFAMFLGAGNIIFAPPLGQAAGSHVWQAMAGFLITGVGLVFLAILALAISGGSVDKLAGRVHPVFAAIFAVLLFMTLGPIYVLPRTAAVVYEISFAPFFLTSEFSEWILPVFSVAFFAATVWLCMNPGEFVNRIGKIITPLFLGGLLVLAVVSVFSPPGQPGVPQGDYAAHAFRKGFTLGYYTMDVLAAFIFGSLFINAARNSGISRAALPRTFIFSGLLTVCLLGLVQLALSWMGATSVKHLGISENGGEALSQIGYLLLGKSGVILFACIVFMTGLTTAVACLAAVAEYFARLFPHVSYRHWLYLFALSSLLITNLGLNAILVLVSPILLVLYPISITLIILVFMNSLFKGRRSVYVGATAGATVAGIIDGLKEAGMLSHSVLETLNAWPLIASGLAWIPAATMGAMLGLIYSLCIAHNGTEHVNQSIV